jgi:hypothetical protein
MVLDTQEEIPLIPGWPFLRDVNARIDVGAEKIQFRIGWRNMTFKFQAKEEQCYLVHDEETRGWRKPQPQYNKEKVAPTKPKVDSLITMIREHWEQDKRHQPKKLKPINKAKGERRRKSRTPSPKPHRLHRHRKKQRRCGVWREHRPSLPLRDRASPRSI